MRLPIYLIRLALALLAVALLAALFLAPVEPVVRAAPQRPSTATGGQEEEPDLETFEPSEDVPIDSSVSFPVDI